MKAIQGWLFPAGCYGPIPRRAVTRSGPVSSPPTTIRLGALLLRNSSQFCAILPTRFPPLSPFQVGRLVGPAVCVVRDRRSQSRFREGAGAIPPADSIHGAAGDGLPLPLPPPPPPPPPTPLTPLLLLALQVLLQRQLELYHEAALYKEDRRRKRRARGSWRRRSKFMRGGFDAMGRLAARLLLKMGRKPPPSSPELAPHANRQTSASPSVLHGTIHP